MTREEKKKAIDALKISAPVRVVTQEEFNDYIQTLNKIMDWLEQESCDDAISRQAVLDLVVSNHTELNGVNVVMYSLLYRDIKSLPPVQPIRPKGEWIPTDYNKYPETYPKAFQQVWETDEYGRVIHRAYGGERNIVAWMPYIEPEPYCGADMRGEENGK